MTAIQAIQRAPWSLRSYAGLIVAMAILTALVIGGSQFWMRVLWAVAFGIGICAGTRVIWWLCVAGEWPRADLGPVPLRQSLAFDSVQPHRFDSASRV
jgi:hypothetical protein